MLTSSLNH
jgi:pyruvate kinase